MYESPIRLIESEIAFELDSEILKAVRRYGIDVNKEELIKAIQNDRQQYEKGYADAKEEYMPRWIPCSDGPPEEEGEYLVCTEFGYRCNLNYAEGWNCYRNCDGLVVHDNEFHSVIAWQPLPEPYREENHE